MWCVANLLDSTLIGFSQGKHLYTSHLHMPILSFSCSDIGHPLAEPKKKVLVTSTPTRGFNAPPTPSTSKSPQDDPETATPTDCTSHSLPTGLQAMLATLLANQNTILKTLNAVLHQSRRGGDPSEDPSERIREVLEEPISSLDALVVFDVKLRGDGALRNLLVDYLECNTDETKKREKVRQMMLLVAKPDVLMHFSLQGQTRRVKRGNEVVDMTKKAFCTLAVYECLKRAARRKNVSAEELRVETAEILKGLSKLKGVKARMMNESAAVSLPTDDDIHTSDMDD